jgi:hypothetical protein
MLSVTNKPFMQSVVMLNVVMLSVVMLNVVAPNPGSMESRYNSAEKREERKENKKIPHSLLDYVMLG